MDVSFIISVSLFLLFVSLILASTINFFTRVPASATILEIRDKVKSLFDVFFGSRGIENAHRITVDLYRVPFLLEEKNGTARTNEVISGTVAFDDTCTKISSWNNTVRVYDQQLAESQSRISYQEFCSSQWLNTSSVTFIVNMSANEKKRVYVYSVNNSNTTAPNHNLTVVGYWKFDDNSGTFGKDSSGRQNNATLKNGTGMSCANGSCPAWMAGKYGNAIQLDGSNDYVDAGNSSDFNIITDMTIAAWINLSVGADGTIAAKMESSGGSDKRPYRLYWSSNKINAQIGGDGSTTTLSGTATVTTGQWTHAVLTINGINASIYVNGQLDASSNVTGTRRTSIQNFTIGADYDGVTLANNFNGIIDDVRVYNQSLTPAQISSLALASNQPISTTIFPAETITAISAAKLQDLSGKNYNEVKAALGGDFDFKIEIRGR